MFAVPPEPYRVDRWCVRDGAARHGAGSSVGIFSSNIIKHDFVGGADEDWFGLTPQTEIGRDMIGQNQKVHKTRLKAMKNCVDSHMEDHFMKCLPGRGRAKLNDYDKYSRERNDEHLARRVGQVKAGTQCRLEVGIQVEMHRNRTSRFTKGGVLRKDCDRKKARKEYMQLQEQEQAKHRKLRMDARSSLCVYMPKKVKAAKRPGSAKPRREVVSSLACTVRVAQRPGSAPPTRSISRSATSRSSERTISAMSLFVPHSTPELFVSEDTADMSLSGLSEAVASYTAELLL